MPRKTPASALTNSAPTRASMRPRPDAAENVFALDGGGGKRVLQ